MKENLKLNWFQLLLDIGLNFYDFVRNVIYENMYMAPLQ